MKKITFVLIIIITTIACNDKSTNSKLVNPKAGVSGNNKYDSVITAYFDAFNKYEWGKIANFYAKDAQFLDPEFGTSYVTKSHADIVAKYIGMQKAMPGLNDSLVSMFAAGDKVAVEFIATGRLLDGSIFRLPLCTIFTFKDGKIVRDATYYDK